MSALTAGTVTDAATLPLAHTPVPTDQVVSGAPTTGYAELEDTGAGSLGLWEHTPGASRDVEVDEVFVVIAGSATVEFIEPAAPAIELIPGSVVRLAAGTSTVWTVHETLRKVYLTPQP